MSCDKIYFNSVSCTVGEVTMCRVNNEAEYFNLVLRHTGTGKTYWFDKTVKSQILTADFTNFTPDLNVPYEFWISETLSDGMIYPFSKWDETDFIYKKGVFSFAPVTLFGSNGEVPIVGQLDEVS